MKPRAPDSEFNRREYSLGFRDGMASAFRGMEEQLAEAAKEMASLRSRVAKQGHEIRKLKRAR